MSASASRARLSPADALSARATLMAHGWPSETRSARKTAPKPPCPSSFLTRNAGRSGFGTTNGVGASSLAGGAGGGAPWVTQLGAPSRRRLPQLGQRIMGPPKYHGAARPVRPLGCRPVTHFATLHLGVPPVRLHCRCFRQAASALARHALTLARRPNRQRFPEIGRETATDASPSH